jgi:hypothetical protein
LGKIQTIIDMRQYSFHTLNSTDFEHLVRDLLNADAKAQGKDIIYRSFPEGRDQGIDLLDEKSEPEDYNIIVQVKHQPNIAFPAFLAALTRSTHTHKSEIEKVKKLVPNRYILATSRSLTLANREDIMEGMNPYIRSLRDVIDREELNRLLSVHPEIEVKHQKLWFSSVPVFEKIVHNDVHGRSEQLAEDIRQKLRLYVPVNDIEEAMSILNATQFIVIVGEPGCGKTTFAEIILHKLAGMDFTAYWIDKSVSEVEGQLKEDETKQVFYFDDFLGHTRYEIEMGRSQEKGLLHFLKRVTRYPNKYFILTTRTSLINAAAVDSERFRNSGIFKEKQEISIQYLSTQDKVSIIKNHLDVKEVPDKYARHLIADRLQVIAIHTNFSPRLIDFVTQSDNYNEISPAGYFDYILAQLKNPHEIWLHAYEEQLDDYDRFLLTTLYSFGEAVREEHLEKAYEERLSYEVRFNNITRNTNSFRRSLKKLLGSFITFKSYYEGDRLEFINPSLEDFLNYYLKDNAAEKLRMANSFLFAEQIYHRFRSAASDHLLINPSEVFRQRIESGVMDTTIKMSGDAKKSFLLLYSAIICRMFFRDERAVATILSFLKKVNWQNLSSVNYFHLYTFLQASADDNGIRDFIIRNFTEIILSLIGTTQQVDRLQEIKTLFEEFQINYPEFIANSIHQEEVKSRIDSFFEDEVFDEMESMHDVVLSLDDVGGIREKLENDILEQYEIMEIDAPANLHDFDDANWESIVATNYFNEQMRKTDEEVDPIRHDD